MKVSMNKGAIPIGITYRRILEKPKIRRRRKFVGPIQTIKNMIVKTIELLEDAAFETETEVLSPGRTVSVNWAIGIKDPWASNFNAEMVAHKMDQDMPPCGVHFEVIEHEEKNTGHGQDVVHFNENDQNALHNSLRQMPPRSAEDAISNIAASITRPVAGEYAPRAVEPVIDDINELVEFDELPHEIAEKLSSDLDDTNQTQEA